MHNIAIAKAAPGRSRLVVGRMRAVRIWGSLWSAAGLASLLVLCASARAQSDEAVLSLAALVEEAQRSHPEVESAKFAARAASEVPSRVGSLPDPMLSGSVQNIPFNDVSLHASPMSGIQVGLSQAVPFPGKLGRRRQVAREAAVTADRDAELAQASVRLKVEQAYWGLSYAERAYAISAESEGIINAIADAVNERFSVAQAAQQDALQAEVAHSRLRALLERRRQAIVSARRTLNAAVGRAPEAPLSAKPAPPPTSSPQLDLRRLTELAQKHNPTLSVAQGRVRVSQRALDEAEWDRIPDFAAGLGYRFRGRVPGDPTHGSDMFTVTLGMTLPVWLGRKQGARVRETRERYSEAQEHAASVALDVNSELQRQVDAIERLGREIVLNEKEVLPEADQALDASITDYQYARVGFVSVLRNWETQLDVKLEYLRLRTERAERLAVLAFLTGSTPWKAP